MIKGKIVLIPFPFDDLLTTKVRPAVCLTEPIGEHRHLILAFITSHIPESLLETDIIIDSNDENFPLTGLHVSSTIRLHRLMTVSASIICRELGELSAKMKQKVKEKLIRLFELE